MRSMDRLNQKLKTRKRLVEAALKLSGEAGFAALSLREVARAAGVTPTAFYRHFPDMDALGLALVDEVGIGLRQLMRTARYQYEVKGRAVRASIETFVKYVVENENLFRLLLGQRSGSSSEFRKALHAEIDRFVGELTEDLERESISLNQRISKPALAAEAIVAVVFTIGAEALDLPKHKRLELTERLIEEIKIILRGARATHTYREKQRLESTPKREKRVSRRV